jgi:pSer/pThr/pTyr-binding forkhead associated (FHA) protein
MRLPESRRDVLVLEPGVHAVTASLIGIVAPVEDHVPLAHIYVDSRGIWLQVREGLRGAYVNGRPIRHMAMLRAGDALFLQGHEVLLVGREPGRASPAGDDAPRVRGPVRCVLRAVGGPHHGRCFSLARPLSIGASTDCDVRIDDARVAGRHLELQPLPTGVAVAVAPQSSPVLVNGHRVEDALLHAGDQLVLAGTHRFVLEAPRPLHAGEPRAEPKARAAVTAPARAASRSARRIPWLLLAAALLAVALSLLLLYGAG